MEQVHFSYFLSFSIFRLITPKVLSNKYRVDIYVKVQIASNQSSELKKLVYILL